MVTLSLRGSGDRAIVAECERMYGLHVSGMEVVSEINILVFSTRNFRITNLSRRKKMKDNSLDGNIEHSGGLSGTGSPSDSCTVVLTEIAAAVESQLELVSGVREDSIRFSSDGRLSCPPSFVLTFSWTRDAAESRKVFRCLLPGPRKNCKPLRCRSIRRLCESQAARRCTRLPLCLEPASVASACPSHHLAHSHQGAMYLPANLSTLPKYLQNRLQFWTTPGPHNHRRKSSEWIWVKQQRKRSTTGFSTAADQAGEGSRNLAATPRCTALGDVTAAHATEVREDLLALPRAFGSMVRHAEEYPLLHPGHLRSLRWVRVLVTGDFDEGRIGGFERQVALLCQIYGMLEAAAKDSCSDCPTPTPDQTSTGCPPKLQQSSHGTRKQRRSRTANDTGRWRLLGLSAAWRSTRRSCREASPSCHAARTGGAMAQRPKEAMQTEVRVVIFHDAGPAGPRNRARQFPQHRSGWLLVFFAKMSSFFPEKQSSRNLSARRSPQLVPATPLGGVGSRCPIARAIVRAVTATKHEPRLPPSYRVVSYGSALEVWALLQRARSEGMSVVPPQRAAWIRCLLSGDWRCRCKALFFRCAQRNSCLRPRTSQILS